MPCALLQASISYLKMACIASKLRSRGQAKSVPPQNQLAADLIDRRNTYLAGPTRERCMPEMG